MGERPKIGLEANLRRRDVLRGIGGVGVLAALGGRTGLTSCDTGTSGDETASSSELVQTTKDLFNRISNKVVGKGGLKDQGIHVDQSDSRILVVSKKKTALFKLTITLSTTNPDTITALEIDRLERSGSDIISQNRKILTLTDGPIATLATEEMAIVSGGQNAYFEHFVTLGTTDPAKKEIATFPSDPDLISADSSPVPEKEMRDNKKVNELTSDQQKLFESDVNNVIYNIQLAQTSSKNGGAGN